MAATVEFVSVVVNGVMTAQTPAQIAASFGAGNIKTATKDFAFNWRGHTIRFARGVPVVVTPELTTALALHGAPVT